MFKDDPLFSCNSDGDCEGSMKCAMASESSTSGICRSRDWCEMDHHCGESEICVSGTCVAGEISCGVGECANTVDACQSGAPAECEPKDPTADVCDGLDNDCDGIPDNDPDVRLAIEADTIIDNCSGLTYLMHPLLRPGNPREYE